jgi:hypothetical protein
MASRPMPWWKFTTGTRHHSKLMRLRALLGNRLADAYVFRLWDYCAERQADGVFAGRGAALEIALAVDFDGPPEGLLGALVDSGLLDADGDTYAVHDWVEMQGALVRKFETDATRSAGRTRPATLSRISPDVVPMSSRSCPDDVPRGTSGGPSPYLKISSLSSQEGGAGETAAAGELALFPEAAAPAKTRRKAEPRGDPRHKPLTEALVQADSEVTGRPYAHRGGRDAKAVSECIALADQDPSTTAEAAPAEILRRWRIARRWKGFPTCNSLQDLATHWNAYAREQAATAAVNPRAPVRAESQPQYDPSKPGLQTFTGKNAL